MTPKDAGLSNPRHTPQSSTLAEATSRRFARFKAYLDVVSTITLILTCVAVSWYVVKPAAAGPNRNAGKNSSGKPGVVPKLPVTMAGSEFLGNKTQAKLAVIEFSDFECPFCRKFAAEIFPTVQRKYIQTGELLFAFRQFPLPIHTHARGAALMAACASEQGAFWAMHDLLFRDVSNLTADPLLNAKAVGVDPVALSRCVDSAPAAEAVETDLREGKALQVTGTPTFFFGHIGPNGTLAVTQRIEGMRDIASFDAAVDSLWTSGRR